MGSMRAPSFPGAASVASVALAAALVAFVVYVSRLCPTLYLAGDSAELTTAAVGWGVPHPPGYPLFTAIGHAFASLPFGEVPWRVHLTSAVFHAVCIGVVVAATRAMTGSVVAGLAAGVALGTSRAFFLGSLYAEVFPLNDAFAAALFAAGLGARGAAGRSRVRWLYGFGTTLGLAAAHHMMIALALPALALLVVRPLSAATAGDRRVPYWFALSCVFPAVAAYALVPIAAARFPYVSWDGVHDLRSLAHLLLRTDYGGPFSAARRTASGRDLARMGAFARLLLASLGVPVVAGAVLGVAVLCRRSVELGLALVLAFVATGPLFAWANALDTESEATLAYFERFLTMCQVPVAMAFGAAVAVAFAWAGDRRAASVAVGGVCVAWAAWSARRVADIDLGADRRGLAYAHDLVRAAPDGAIVLLSGDEPGAAGDYVCAVERACGDRIVLSPGTLSMPWKMAEIRRRYPGLSIPWSAGPALRRVHEIVAAAGDRPVFVIPSLLAVDPALSDSFLHFPDRLLMRVWPREAVPTKERAVFAASAEAMVDGGCAGCDLPVAVPVHPSQDVQILAAYGAAYRNHARAAIDAPGLTDLAARLAERASAFEAAAQGGGSSMSR
jgi:hypothetical protein